MTTPAGVWDQTDWGNSTWGTVPPAVFPPQQGTFADIAAALKIEASTALVYVHEVTYNPPPPKIVPLRNFRSQMNDYRIVAGIPVNPPVLDVAVPVLVSVSTSGQVPVPSEKRPLPDDITTSATLRFIAEDLYVTSSPDGSVLSWTDTTGAVAWTGYDVWQPSLDDDYSYQLATKNSAELIPRSAMVFEAMLGQCMNANFYGVPLVGLADLEFWFVVNSHAPVAGMRSAGLLDTGDLVQGFNTMPFNPGDSLVGEQLAVTRYLDKIIAWQDDVGYPLVYPMVIGSGRPVLLRARFGQHPLIEGWGPGGSHVSYRPQPLPQADLACNWVLGRIANQVSMVTNGGMHLFEIDYFDHMLADSDATALLHSLDSCYAVSA